MIIKDLDKVLNLGACKTLLHAQLPPPLLQSKYQESSENLQTLSAAPTCMEYILFTIMIKPNEQIYHLNPFDPSNKTLITAKLFLIIIKTKTVK